MPVSDSITLVCPRCKLRVMTKREKWDYPEADTMETLCPECVGGDFDLPSYFDATGAEVLYDPAEIPKHRKRLEAEALAEK